MKKRILSFLLVLTSILLAFSLTSCGMLEGIFGKEEKKEITIRKIANNLVDANCVDLYEMRGDEESRALLERCFGSYISVLFDGELENAIWSEGRDWALVAFECESNSDATDLLEVASYMGIQDGFYSQTVVFRVEKNFLFVASSYDIIEVALGEREYWGTGTNTGSGNTDSDHNHNHDHNTDTNTDTNTNTDTSTDTEISTDGCYHWYDDDCDAYCNGCGEERETPHYMSHMKTVAPTCVDEGYDVYWCEYCGLTEHSNFTDPSYAWEAHSFEKVRVEPTCTNDGYERYACYFCGMGEGETIVLPQIDHEYVDGYCTMCEGEQPVYTREDDTIYFGTYPQAEVTDSDLQSTLNSLVGNLPTGDYSYDWTSYGYYMNGYVSNYMWYIDVENDGEKYRGVYFTSYRPCCTIYSSSTDNIYQDENGYYTSTIYWFKYEPLSWTILNQNNGTALIFCDMIIDGQQFDYENGSYYNDYAESTIRVWLNETFYNTAFDELQKEIILTTTVDNSAESTGYSPNNYACEDTEDKIFLLSSEEVTTYFTLDTARQKKTTDYAQSQGVYSSYSGNGCWWLRSPYYDYSSDARGVRDVGDVYYNYVYFTSIGIVPALTIQLD